MNTIKHLFRTNKRLLDYVNTATPLASGSFSTVFQVTDTLVLKETADLAYLKFLDAVSSKALTATPVVYDRRYLKGSTYVLLEKLSKVTHATICELDNEAEALGYCYRQDPEMFLGLDVPLDNTLRHLINKIPKYLTWDVHITNFMQRGNQLIVTDPWMMEIKL